MIEIISTIVVGILIGILFASFYFGASEEIIPEELQSYSKKT